MLSSSAALRGGGGASVEGHRRRRVQEKRGTGEEGTGEEGTGEEGHRRSWRNPRGVWCPGGKGSEHFKRQEGTSLAAQCLGLCPSPSGDMGSRPLVAVFLGGQGNGVKMPAA